MKVDFKVHLINDAGDQHFAFRGYYDQSIGIDDTNKNLKVISASQDEDLQTDDKVMESTKRLCMKDLDDLRYVLRKPNPMDFCVNFHNYYEKDGSLKSEAEIYKAMKYM